MKEVRLNDKMWFGKHKGSRVMNIIKTDPSFIQTMVKEKKFVLDEKGNEFFESRYGPITGEKKKLTVSMPTLSRAGYNRPAYDVLSDYPPYITTARQGIPRETRVADEPQPITLRHIVSARDRGVAMLELRSCIVKLLGSSSNVRSLIEAITEYAMEKLSVKIRHQEIDFTTTDHYFELKYKCGTRLTNVPDDLITLKIYRLNPGNNTLIGAFDLE